MSDVSSKLERKIEWIEEKLKGINILSMCFVVEINVSEYNPYDIRVFSTLRGAKEFLEDFIEKYPGRHWDMNVINIDNIDSFHSVYHDYYIKK